MRNRNTKLGWIYLAVSINGAAYTLNAYRPARNNRLLFFWSFFASWITIELAPFHLVWQVIATGFFASRGALRSRPGRIGLAVTLASWAGLALAVRQSMAARHEIRAALRDLQHDEPDSPPLPVRVERNITFARAGGRALRLDVHAPAVAAEPGVRRPALVQVHGGGWVIGFKDRQGQLLMRRLAAQGWVCFNIDYRLSPGATFPDHLVDVKRAVAWIREHADDYGIDPEFVAVTGGSAGGHLTALTALTANDPQYQPGFEDANTAVQAAVPFYGGQPPAAEVPKIKAPLLIHYAGDDERINAGRPAYEAALKAAHLRHEAHIYPGTQHGFNNDTTPRFDKAAAQLAWGRTMAFFKATLA